MGLKLNGSEEFDVPYDGIYIIKASSYADGYPNMPVSLHCEPAPEKE